MQFTRLLRHVAAPHWRTRLLFPKKTLDAIELAVGRAERTHAGEIRFAIETALPPAQVLQERSVRDRALEVFANLRVWDTDQNNGVLIYVQLADRGVEIVADRGLHARVGPAEWEAVCRLMEEHFRAGATTPDRSRVSMPWARCWRAIIRRGLARRQRMINCLIGRLCCR